MNEHTNEQNVFDHLRSAFGDSVEKVELDKVGCAVIWVKKEKLIEILRELKEREHLAFEFLADLTAYDDLGEPEESKGRFVMVYNLLSLSQKKRLRVKARVADGEAVPTAVPLWKAANWAEREVWDVYGIPFTDHPDLRRILLDQRFEGFPQRKDYHWRKYQIFLDAEPIPEQLLKD